MPGKAKAAPRRGRGASGRVVAGRRDTRKITPSTDHRQARTEREICDGRVYLGTVRERADGSFVAVVDEMVLGPYDTIAAATNKVLELAKPGAAP